ncbi:SGNH/GDSL hydrolase family protein [Roseateles violae]|uniref:SGNH/GDSL hydrolase family protein n=1 Tax=Roseateles violae TaxID=3058042 RepID=A0ABT8DTE6_9BURK|nr:SGNH/GDSL hydrolase family protein [Pelomonas sp. PFR6]MDN3920323.1 SGNH/GDSL hydrolase family protein [Pelomonas sp. PFR6]
MKMNKLMAAGLLGMALLGTAAADRVPADLVQTSGRIVPISGGGWLATWPGVNWRLRIRGESLGLRLDDALNYWVVEVDGQAKLQIAPEPGERLIWLRGLGAGEHDVRLVKRTESSAKAARVLGFELEHGDAALPPATKPAQRIEFIGDSYTAAMGNISPGRACTGPEIGARTDITQGFAVLTARALGAEWQIHAKTGAGLVRNWAGGLPDETHGTHYARALQDDPSSLPARDWLPQTVVIGLGTNDFSTAVKPGEPRDAEALERDFLQAYRALLADLRQRYGDPSILLLSLPLPANGDRLRPLVQRLVDEQQAAGHRRIGLLDWGPLKGGGCGSHPDADDHRHMAELLLARLKELQ